jgi:hypothetical protein
MFIRHQQHAHPGLLQVDHRRARRTRDGRIGAGQRRRDLWWNRGELQLPLP